MKNTLLAPLFLSALCAIAGCAAAPKPAEPPAQKRHVYAREIFDEVSPSVVAVLNDDKRDREEETKELMKAFGDESKAPKRVLDVSLRKEPMPHGTGFMIADGRIVTAAHVVRRPDRLKVTTRAGQTVEADLDVLDEFRDIAILKPKQPLKDVPPLKLSEEENGIGEQVWAMGHTGQGIWALSWGISEGIASGVVEYMGVKTLVFDASVYPGFSGGPVLRRNKAGHPEVVGVSRAILFTGGYTPVASISSATSVPELREVVAGRRHPFEQKLAEYAKKQTERQWADLFVTSGLNVHRDAHGQPVAEIFGNLKHIEGRTEGAFIPVAAMLFHLPVGQREVVFELRDPHGQVVSTATRTVGVGEKQRVSFVSAGFRFEPKGHGRYEVTAKHDGKSLGSVTVSLSLSDEDDELVDDHDHDVSDDGDPDVDIVVAQLGNAEPLMLSGVRASWAEKSYPRRVAYTWFARGTRGWSGTNVAIGAYVVDQDGKVVGQSTGCYRPELRPEHPWSCMGHGGEPLTLKEGVYDVVFAINDRPVAIWPMEAAIRTEHAPGSDVERWLKEMTRRKAVVQKKKPEPPPPPIDPKAKPTDPKAKPPTNKPAPKPATAPKK